MKKYEAPVAKVLKFQPQDFITTSDNVGKDVFPTPDQDEEEGG